MKLVITIDCDNEAFNGQDCGTEIANILNRIMRSMEFESKKELLRAYRGKPHKLADTNGNTVGSLRFTCVADLNKGGRR